jgi:hypothetical protein
VKRGTRDYVAGAILFVPACLVLFALFRTGTRDWWPVADNASTWLRTWDVGTRHSPLVGPFSRLGFHHPGPMMFYLFAGPLRLLRGDPSGLLAGALAIAFASAIGVVWFSVRHAGQATMLILSVALAVLAMGHGDRLIEPWNPFLIVLPFALFLVTAWFASAGNAAAAMVAAVCGSLAAQSHLGALPPVLIIAATALLLRVAWPPSGAPRIPNGKVSLRVAATVALLWTPPAIEQLLPTGRNVSKLFSYFGSRGPDPRVGWKNAVALTGAELHPWGPWTGVERAGFVGEVLPGPPWVLPAVLLSLVVALALALRFRDHVAVRLVALEGSAIVACAAAIANVRGVPFHYLLLWSRPIAMLAVAAPLLVLARRVDAAIDEKIGNANLGTAIGLSIVAVPIAVCALRAEVPTPFWSHVHIELIKPAISVAPRGSTVRVAAIGPYYTGSPEALAIALERSGRKAKMMPWYAPAVGKHRTIPATAAVSTLVLATGVGVERVPHKAMARTLFERDRMGSQKRAAIIARRKKLEEALLAARRRDLLEALDSSVPWLWLSVPPSIDQAELNLFLKDTVGEEKIPIALYSLPPVTW